MVEDMAANRDQWRLFRIFAAAGQFEKNKFVQLVFVIYYGVLFFSCSFKPTPCPFIIITQGSLYCLTFFKNVDSK